MCEFNLCAWRRRGVIEGWGAATPPVRAMEHHHRFRRFLEQIRLSPAQVHELRRGHLELSGRLRQDPALRPHFVTTFLQGSYRRSTALRPLAGQDGSDVDLVLVTSLDPRKDEPEVALRLLRPFLQQHYPRVRVQDRSFRITLDGVTLDLVLAAAPSRAALERLRGEARAEPLEDCFEPTDAELEAWKDEPLWIPDRAAQAWRRTHPLAQVASTRTKNARCNQHYVNVVKALKCWRLHAPGMPEHPKSYPLERIVEECCPDEITSVEEGVVLTLEAIGRRFKSGRKPRLRAHGVRGTDVLERVPEADFAAFLRCVGEAVVAARAAFECEEPSESVAGWARLLGPAFPVEVSEAPRGRGRIVRVESAGPARSTEEFQDSCRLDIHACFALKSRSGLRQTTGTGSQARVLPDQRSGWRRRAAS